MSAATTKKRGRYEPMSGDIDYRKLDPGIREVVRKLRDLGWETTDSGDGVSKPAMTCAMPFPNVAVETTRVFFFHDAQRLARDLDRIEPRWTVEATYWPASGSVILLATRKLPRKARK